MNEPTWLVWLAFFGWLACITLLAHRHLGPEARRRRRLNRIVRRHTRPPRPPRSHVHRHPDHHREAS